MHEIVCAGHVNWDVTLQVDGLPEPDGEAHIASQTQAGGGSASNTAVVLAGLECEPLLLGSIGTDSYGSLVRDELGEAGVDCAHLKAVEGTTTVKYLVVDDAGQVMILANDGVNEAFTAADLPAAALTSADHLHLTSQEPTTALALAQRAQAAGVSVSFDPGRRLQNRDYDDVVAAADIVFFNEREAATARNGGLFSVAEATTVIKQGNGGAVARRGDEEVTHAGFDVDPADTAGAGDAFAAGFLAAKLAGADLEAALAVGNACGAVAVQTVGARTALSWEDVSAFLPPDLILG